MAKGVLSDESKRLIQYLMANEKIAAKVKAAGGQEKSYAIYSIEDCGTIILGETKYRFINRLFNCQFPLTFVQFASAVWDALVDFSSGLNKAALKKGLGQEIIEKTQRDKEYDWAVERLVDCYRHVCNGGGANPEGFLEKSGPSMTEVTVGKTPVNLHINLDGKVHRTIRFPDVTGKAHLVVDMGVTDVHTEVDE